MNAGNVRLLRVGFAAGAVTDALAILPMLFPRLASLLWGLDETGWPYRFAMGYGAALMLGWTGLLVWAYRHPLERRGVALLTLVVIAGFVVTEILAVLAGALEARNMLPSWVMQTILGVLFAWGYISSSPRATENQV